ncbi:acyl carrier protein [Hymenobacter terrenus]|uniref:hypothetical protein n=1 Tax=Hymenobacter terrenus TaxID=1629124 RepID=UPI000697AC2D|nr:hypothetical protein [Hymenobacter terrenus]
MTPTSVFASRFIWQQVLRITGQHEPFRLNSLRLNRWLIQLCLDLLEAVEIILELEDSFHITIPDDVPFITPDEFSYYMATHTPPPEALTGPLSGAGHGCEGLGLKQSS